MDTMWIVCFRFFCCSEWVHSIKTWDYICLYVSCLSSGVTSDDHLLQKTRSFQRIHILFLAAVYNFLMFSLAMPFLILVFKLPCCFNDTCCCCRCPLVRGIHITFIIFSDVFAACISVMKVIQHTNTPVEMICERTEQLLEMTIPVCTCTFILKLV